MWLIADRDDDAHGHVYEPSVGVLLNWLINNGNDDDDHDDNDDGHGHKMAMMIVIMMKRALRNARSGARAPERAPRSALFVW